MLSRQSESNIPADSFFFGEELVEKAVDSVLPAVYAMMASGRLKRHNLHIVVLNPLVQPWNGTFEEAILFEKSLGNPYSWEHPYDKIARSKAEISWHTSLPSQMVQLRMPQHLVAGNTVYWGSAVLDGIIVAASGVQPWFDQMIAGWIAEACRAFAIDATQKYREINPEADFLTN